MREIRGKLFIEDFKKNFNNLANESPINDFSFFKFV